MANLNTRPRLHNRQVRQLSGDTLTLSGDTTIVSTGYFGLGSGSTFQFLTNPQSGYVLTSDSGGTISLQSPPPTTIIITADTINNNIVTGNTDNYYVSGGTYNESTKELEFVGNNVVTTFNVNVSGLTSDNVGAFTSTTINNRIIPTNTYDNTTNSNYSSILGGSGNTISNSLFSSISGGRLNINRVGSYGAFIGAGINNMVDRGQYSSIVGGQNNYVTEDWGFIGGGQGNTQKGTSSLIVGGSGNTIESTSNLSSIVGGKGNNMTIGTKYSLIGGGSNNVIDGGFYNSISGGKNNRLEDGSFASIIGGGGSYYSNQGNVIHDTNYSGIFSGRNNKIRSDAAPQSSQATGAFIGGGRGNYINDGSHGDSNYNVIVGGQDNYVDSVHRSFIGGGSGNTISTTGQPSGYSLIGGGFNNRIIGSHYSVNYDSIVGGKSNYIELSDMSFIGGGQNNTISGGTNEWSSILGGRYNVIGPSHNDTFIIGSNITSISANTTHVEQLYIENPLTETPENILGITTSGMVVEVSGITETLNFGGGGSGDVASLTVLNGIIIGRTLVP